jgi:DNA-binding NarL/FixJ family response regulator
MVVNFIVIIDYAGKNRRACTPARGSKGRFKYGKIPVWGNHKKEQYCIRYKKGFFYPNISNMHITIGLADDQQLFLKSLSTLIGTFSSFSVSLEAFNGEDLLKKLRVAPTQPDILLIDVKMPILDGLHTALQVREEFPAIRMAALSTDDDDATVIQMIRAGCCAYLLKDIHPNELEKALLEIHAKGYYNADVSNINYRRLLRYEKQEAVLSPKEMIFIQFACSDLTYRQIADQMYLSERTIDGYRESVFEKLNVQSRVGMVLEAIKRHLVKL